MSKPTDQIQLPASLLSRALVFTILSLILWTGISSAVDISFGGKTYHNVEVISVKGDTVIFDSKQGQVSIQRDTLDWVQKAKVAEFEKKKATPNLREASRSNRDNRLDPRKEPRVWILGPVGAQKENGITVNSSRYFIESRTSRAREASDKEETKNGAPILTGFAFVRGVKQKPESHFDRVLWRDGFEVIDGVRVPAFSTSNPGKIPLPDLAAERVWTSGGGVEVTATLKSVVSGKGNFIRSNGKPFTYEIEKLIEADQEFVKRALEEHEKLMRILRRDHPGQTIAQTLG